MIYPPTTIVTLSIEIIVVITLLSAFVSTFIEIIGSFLNLRAFRLRHTLKKMLGEKLSNEFFKHSIITNLFEFEYQIFAPFELGKETFSEVILDILDGKNKGKDEKQIIENIENYCNSGEIDGDVKNLILSFLHHSQSIDDFKTKLSDWFDEVGRRTTAIYSRDMKIIGFIIALLITSSFKFDSINYLKSKMIEIVQVQNEEATRKYLAQVLNESLRKTMNSLVTEPEIKYDTAKKNYSPES